MSLEPGMVAGARPATAGPASSPRPGPDRLGWLLFALSAGGLPITWLALRRGGRLGGLLLEAGCAVLLARDAAMVAGGAPGRLRVVPRLLLFLELAANVTAVVAGFRRWVAEPMFGRAPEKVQSAERTGERHGSDTSIASAKLRVSEVAAGIVFILHTARMAIYLSPGRGRKK